MTKKEQAAQRRRALVRKLRSEPGSFGLVDVRDEALARVLEILLDGGRLL